MTLITEMLSPTAWQQASGGPRYLQLSRHIASAIRAGSLAGESPLPSEREMASLTGLSRVTIRKAIEVLVNERLVTPRHGSGNFISPPVEKLEHSLSRLTSFTEDMRRRGKSSSSERISAGLFTPSPEEMMALGLGAGELVARTERLRRADGVPMAIECSALPPDILPNPEAVDTSLYKVLAERGLKPVRAMQRISATRLTTEQARLLEIDIHDPALKIARTGYLASGRIIELTTGIYRGDVYDFVAELQL